MYEVTVVHGAGKGKVIWSGPEIIVMVALGRKKSMQYVLLEAQDAPSSRYFFHSPPMAFLLAPSTDHSTTVECDNIYL